MGDNTASYAGSSAGVVVTVNGAASGGHAAGDTLSDFENLAGSAFADTLTGDAGVNVLEGGTGLDVLRGGAGDDQLYGVGEDTPGSASGHDILIGGLGKDRLYGAAGADTCIINQEDDSGAGSPARDAIFSFDSVADVIRLVDVDADTGTAGNQAFDFIGGAAFSDTAGELRASVILGVNTLIQGDTDGDGATGVEIVLVGLTAPLSAGDFVL